MFVHSLRKKVFKKVATMTSNEVFALISKALKDYDYPDNYLFELLSFLDLSITSGFANITTEQESKLQHILFSLSKQVPVEYLVGTALFYNLRFTVNKNVLIPRPFTEQLVTKSLEIIKDELKDEPFTLIDIGTGSGAIIVSLAKELSKFVNAKFIAIDASLEALDIAKQNAVTHGLSDRIEFQHTSTFPKSNDGQPLIPITKHVFIVSNPPYIPKENMATLPDSVKNYEPSLALEVQEGFVPELNEYLSLLRSKNKTIYCAFEYMKDNKAFCTYAISLQEDLQALLLS